MTLGAIHMFLLVLVIIGFVKVFDTSKARKLDLNKPQAPWNAWAPVS